MHVLVLSPEVALQTALTGWLRFSLPTGQVSAASTIHDGYSLSRGEQVEAVVVDARLLHEATPDAWRQLRCALGEARWVAIRDGAATGSPLPGIDAEVTRSRLFADLIPVLRAARLSPRS